jgi:hypothetical protein
VFLDHHCNCKLLKMDVGCDVLMAVILRGMINWVVMQCTSEKLLHFGGIYRLHLHSRRVGEARKQQKLAAGWAQFSILNMKKRHISETSGFLRNTRHYGDHNNYGAVVVNSSWLWGRSMFSYSSLRFRTWLTLLSWRWKRYIPPKHRALSKPHDDATKKSPPWKPPIQF